jgi:hypothetical protein
MHRWIAEARPILTVLMAAEDNLISGSDEPAVLLRARCDQLDAAARHAESWLAAHRCPDPTFRIYCGELVSASYGLVAIMQMVAREAPDGAWMTNRAITEKVGHNLVDRIQQAVRARTYIREWSA